MEIAHSKTRDQYPLSRRKIVKKTISSMIIWVIFAIAGMVVLGIAAASDPTNPFPVFGIDVLILIALVILTVIIYFYQEWYFAVYFYELSPDYVVIRKGPITPQEITIPYERIQDVYVDQDLLDRFLRIYDVHISSATISSGMKAHIDGVEKPAADGLKSLLLTTVSEKIGKKKNVSAL